MKLKTPKRIVATTATLHALVAAKPDTLIRAFKIVNENMKPYCHPSDLVYAVGKEFSEPHADTNEYNDCAAGLNVGTREWCLLCATHEAGTVLPKHLFMEVEFTRSDVAAFPLTKIRTQVRKRRTAQRDTHEYVIHRYGKFRVRRFRVILARVLTKAEITRMRNIGLSYKKHSTVAPLSKYRWGVRRKKR